MIQKVKNLLKYGIFAFFELYSTISHDTNMQNSLILVIKMRIKNARTLIRGLKLVS